MQPPRDVWDGRVQLFIQEGDFYKFLVCREGREEKVLVAGFVAGGFIGIFTFDFLGLGWITLVKRLDF